MRYLFVLLFVFGCDSGGSEYENEATKIESKIKAPSYHSYLYEEVDKQGMEIHDMNSPKNAGGIVTQLGDDFRFDSHQNFDCIGVLKGWCRKADVGFTEGSKVLNRIVKYTFNFNVIEYNELQPPEWVILYQDWVRIIDGLSNHPMTTIKLIYDQGLKVCVYHNSWQLYWDKPDWGHVPDGSVHDHSPEEQLGCYPIEKNTTYSAEFYISDSGVRSLVVDGNVAFNHLGKTKHETKPHIYSFGLYWSKGYNIEYDASKNIVVTIDQFKRWEFVR